MKTDLPSKSKIWFWYHCLFVLLIFLTACSNEFNPIYIDGQFWDWAPISPVYEDKTPSQQRQSADFGKIRISNDDEYLYLNIEVGIEINLQDNNEIALLIDSDSDVNTGRLIHGIGADLIYEFGNRVGIFYHRSDSITISPYEIGLISAPTVSASQFEIAIKRSSRLLHGKLPVFPAPDIQIALKDLAEDGDNLPDETGGIKYSFGDFNPNRSKSTSLKQDDPNSVRIMTYNVLSDGLFKQQQYASISKIIKAMQPEIMVFQEIYSYDADAALRQIENIIPSSDQHQWHAQKAGRDIIVISRFAIEESTSIDGNGAFLFNLFPKIESELLLIGAHLPCCGNNEGRRNEIDALMDFIRKTKNGQGEIPVNENTPIILAGDLNLVGDSQQLQTLLTGDIQDTIRFGPHFSPDWDNSNLTDLLPYSANTRFSFTWHDRYSSFGPGRLDFMIYSDSVLQPVKKFVLFTPALKPHSLAVYNLNSEDGLNASDHLPVIADFVLSK